MKQIWDFPYIYHYLFLLFIVGCFHLSTRIIFRKRANFKEVNSIYLALLGFVFLGLTIGLLVGNSRESVVNVVISSMLTLIGGMAIYYFKDTESKSLVPEQLDLIRRNKEFHRKLISVILIVFPLSTMYGVHIGAIQRLENESYERNIDLIYERELIETQNAANKELERYKGDVQVELKRRLLELEKKK